MADILKLKFLEGLNAKYEQQISNLQTSLKINKQMLSTVLSENGLFNDQ
jgi:hypothetical protein